MNRRQDDWVATILVVLVIVVWAVACVLILLGEPAS